MITDIQQAKLILHNAGHTSILPVFYWNYPDYLPKEGGKNYRVENVLYGKIRDEEIEKRICDMAEQVIKRNEPIRLRRKGK